MSDVLLIDGNPDHVRPISGLFKYRVAHELDVLPDCVSGLRRIYTNPPDVVLINVMLFASEDYGFARALAEGGGAGVRVVVLISGRPDETRVRTVAYYGASILELPASADELNEAIDGAGAIRSRNEAPQAVSWAPADGGTPANGGTPADAGTRAADAAEPDRPSVERVAWSSFDGGQAADENGVRAVDWAVDGGGTTSENPSSSNQGPDGATQGPSRPRRTTPDPPSQTQPPADRRVPKAEAADFRPAFTSAGEGFRPLGGDQPAADAKTGDDDREEKPRPFRASNFNNLDDADPGRVKNR